MVASLLAGLLLLDATAGASPPPSSAVAANCPVVIEASARTKYLSLPSAVEMSRYYPPVARHRRMEDLVKLLCTVAPDGHLNDCSVVSDEHPDQGFDKATFAAASKVRVAPESISARPGCPLDQPPRFLLKMHWGLGE
jgi:TonB family protein